MPGRLAAACRSDVGPRIRFALTAFSWFALLATLLLWFLTAPGMFLIANRGNPHEVASIIANGTLYLGALGIDISDARASERYVDFNRCGNRWLMLPTYGDVAVPRSELRVPLYWLVGVFVPLPALSIFRTIRRIRRAKHGRCLSCGYDLSGNITGRCPECGAAISSPHNTMTRPVSTS